MWIFECSIHPEGTSIGSDNSDILKVSDFNGSLWNVSFSPKNNLNDTTQFSEDIREIDIKWKIY